MFQFEQQRVKIMQINSVAENHGEEVIPAHNLKIVAYCHNDILFGFHPELRRTLFSKSADPDLVEQTQIDALSALRFPQLGSVKWTQEMAGYSLKLQWGLAADIRIDDCQMKAFKFTPIKGGAVKVEFNVHAKIAKQDVGKICEFIKREIEIDLLPPEDCQTSIAA